jgi:hypothetical protein
MIAIRGRTPRRGASQKIGPMRIDHNGGKQTNEERFQNDL